MRLLRLASLALFAVAAFNNGVNAQQPAAPRLQRRHLATGRRSRLIKPKPRSPRPKRR